VTFVQYDLGDFDDETCRLGPIDNPFGPKVLPMSLIVASVIALVGGEACAQPSQHRFGPSYLYPAATPGAVNPDVAQANIADTICNLGWTATICPPASYRNQLKKQQLAAPRFKDKAPSHYEEDHYISLELGGHPGIRRICGRRCGARTARP
jgi:hypothetical protein